jgi:transposase
MRKSTIKKENYSMSLISAISPDMIIANQVVEGGVDGIIFENFIYHTLLSVRNDKHLQQKKVLLLLDNARIHKTQHLYETAKKMKAVVLFNAAYSPWLNPIE